eukprot:5980122-Alexandrium_andersonii.AAC.1
MRARARVHARVRLLRVRVCPCCCPMYSRRHRSPQVMSLPFLRRVCALIEDKSYELAFGNDRALATLWIIYTDVRAKKPALG